MYMHQIRPGKHGGPLQVRLLRQMPPIFKNTAELQCSTLQVGTVCSIQKHILLLVE